MRLFLLNILLALFWAAVSGSFAVPTLLAGFGLGYVVLLLIRPAFGSSAYYGGLWRVLAFAAFYVWELILSSVRVAHDVLTPRLRARPGVIGLELEARTDLEITVLANLISLTPGTLSLDVSSDRTTLYIHAMYLDEDADDLRRDLKEQMERRVLELLRSREGEAPASETPTSVTPAPS